ncbi:hypothetical protein [Oceanirhabdus sp. W0125-5]|uniref:hypothetical protein n=1 Tax=Oceanirhabdus sp. W0125-5 TaxID=2999116 RepID=UPI0022F3461E|nr:hypothetical protein [Oceanirhabdus sp. W0125-5]WBW95322.1 hypothetical protein OW730_16690 [Oceanirhabdus sp. W0125-5]
MGKEKKAKKAKETMSHKKWVFYIILWTILLGGTITSLSDLLLKNAEVLVAFVILILIIAFGVVLDTVGTAVTAANETPFHSMAAKKVPGAKLAVKLVRNADKVSNFCNDVIGDICGIVSGTASGIIVNTLVGRGFPIKETLLSALMGSLVAAGTVGGKAMGKNIAIKYSNDIVFKVAQIVNMIKKEG